MWSSVVDSSIRQDTKLNDSRIASAQEQYRNGQQRIMQLINKDHYRDRIICGGRNEGTLMIFFLLSPRRVVPLSAHSRCRLVLFLFLTWADWIKRHDAISRYIPLPLCHTKFLTDIFMLNEVNAQGLCAMVKEKEPKTYAAYSCLKILYLLIMDIMSIEALCLPKTLYLVPVYLYRSGKQTNVKVIRILPYR